MTSKDLDRLNELEKDIPDLQDAQSKTVLEMVEIIDTIPYEKTRKIFRLKYIYHRSWQQIADELGYSDTQGPRAKVRRYKKAVYVTSQAIKNKVK